MIHFKNSAGFTLIEVLLATMIVAMALTPILILQSRIIEKVTYYSWHVARIFFAKEFLHEMVQDKTGKMTFTKKITDPDTTLRYERIPSEKANKKLKLPGLFINHIEVSWQEMGTEKKDTFIGLSFIPEPEE